MPDLLFLAHRIPYPPDKGEKIRAFNILTHLARTHRIHLGCLVDTPEDQAHTHPLKQWCETIGAFPIDKARQKIATLLRARPGRPLMLDYYRSPALHAWTRQTLATHPIATAHVNTVAMMPYVEHLQHVPRRPRPHLRPRIVLDAQDIDSEKWATYAHTAPFPMSLVWAREGRTLLAYERQAAMAADATLFVSPQETARFAHLAPETAPRLHSIENGVDLARFSPTLAFDNPFTTPGPHLVFTGHMDYWPNVDAVTWFATEIMPPLRAAHPSATFHIVGANPAPATTALAAQPGIQVTGRVPDPRPYLAHAQIVVAPLRIARGIQNKVLEAMAMARPVIASPQAFEGVHATPGQDLLVAATPETTVAAATAILAGHHPHLGTSARQSMERRYAWDATLAPLDPIMTAGPAPTVLTNAA